MSKVALYRCCLAVAMLGLVNGAAGILMLFILHGNATGSKVVDGHYYFVSHGRSTEVSRRTYEFSRWHNYSLMVTTPLCVVSALCANYLLKRWPSVSASDTQAKDRTP